MMRRLLNLRGLSTVAVAASSYRWQSDEASKNDTSSQRPVEETEKLTNGEESKTTGDTNEAYKASLAQLRDNEAKIEELRKDVLYAAASADNIRKESKEQVASAKTNAENTFAKDLLEAADALEKVCATIGNYRGEEKELTPKVTALLNGVDLSFKVILKVFQRHGVDRMETQVGTPFDSKQHFSLFTAPSTDSIKSGHITEVVKSGYTRGGAILRHAEVGVAEDSEK